MSVTAGDGLALVLSGRAHHSHLSSLARDGLAHLCSDFGVGLAPGQASSSPLSAEPSIWFCPDKHPGHSSGSALFRKGTFGADYTVLTAHGGQTYLKLWLQPDCQYKHPGHSSGSALFRKGTFGADNQGAPRPSNASRCSCRQGVRRPGRRPGNVRVSGSRSRSRPWRPRTSTPPT